MSRSRSLPFDTAVLELLQEGVWISDANHRLVFANAAMARLAGVEVRELLGKAVTDFPEETLLHFRPRFVRAVDALAPVAYECPVVTPAGRATWQSGWLTPRIESGGYAGMVCTGRDATDERRQHLCPKLYIH